MEKRPPPAGPPLAPPPLGSEKAPHRYTWAGLTWLMVGHQSDMQRRGEVR